MKITSIKNSCLLINFGENQKVSDLLKNGKVSIGINSKFTDHNFDLFDAMRKKIIIKKKYILDYSSINALMDVYAQYIEQLTRWNISDSNFPDPRHLYDDFINSLNYWYNFLKYFDINKIYIYEDPHRSYDLLIYVLAKQLKIKIYIFSELNTGYRTFIKQNIEDNLLSVKDNFPFSNKAISNKLKYNHFKSQFISKNIFEKIYDFIEKIPKIFKYHDSYIYSDNEAFIKINPFRFILWKTKRYIKTLIYKFYHKIYARTVSLFDGDILFYLHYEPERTSNPLSGEARNQIYCIKLLRKSFPEKKIYIKEHPSQLNLKNTHLNRQYRDKKFLDELLTISDGIVEKISNNSQFIVATLNGTVGLEYSLKGYNVVCFGHAWYSFLQNVYSVKSSKDLKDIRFNKHNPQEINKELEDTLFSKSAKGSVSNKLEKSGKNEDYTSDDNELLNYIEWYFSNSKNL